MSGNKIVRVTYSFEDHFLIPSNINLENKEQVVNWWIKYNTLRVELKNGKILEINSIGLCDDIDMKHTDYEEILDADEAGYDDDEFKQEDLGEEEKEEEKKVVCKSCNEECKKIDAAVWCDCGECAKCRPDLHKKENECVKCGCYNLTEFKKVEHKHIHCLDCYRQVRNAKQKESRKQKKQKKAILETKCGCHIIINSREHDECRCDDDGENWICGDCYNGEYDEEEEEEEVGLSKCPCCENTYTEAQIQSEEVVPCIRCYKCFVGDCGNTSCDCEFTDDDDCDCDDAEPNWGNIIATMMARTEFAVYEKDDKCSECGLDEDDCECDVCYGKHCDKKSCLKLATGWNRLWGGVAEKRFEENLYCDDCIEQDCFEKCEACRVVYPVTSLNYRTGGLFGEHCGNNLYCGACCKDIERRKMTFDELCDYVHRMDGSDVSEGWSRNEIIEMIKEMEK